MHPDRDQFLPAADVRSTREDETTVLTSAAAGAVCTLSASGEEVWALLQQDRGRTLDRLVMAMARRSSGQALTEVPDTVVSVLDDLISRGLVQRVAA
jgi:hypothetical protein